MFRKILTFMRTLFFSPNCKSCYQQAYLDILSKYATLERQHLKLIALCDDEILVMAGLKNADVLKGQNSR